MIKAYNNKSLALGLPGFVLQFAGLLVKNFRPELARLGSVLLLLGTALLMAGLAYYAMAKGRNPAWCLMAVFSLLGFIVLGLLKDHSGEAKATQSDAPRRAPMPSAAGRADRATGFPDPAPGHEFNTYGVCTRCGCGRSAGHRPCGS